MFKSLGVQRWVQKQSSCVWTTQIQRIGCPLGLNYLLLKCGKLFLPLKCRHCMFYSFTHHCCRKTEMSMRKQTPFPSFLSLLNWEKLPRILRISACRMVKCLKCGGFNEPVPFLWWSPIPVFPWAIAHDLNSKQLGTSGNQNICHSPARASKRCKEKPWVLWLSQNSRVSCLA